MIKVTFQSQDGVYWAVCESMSHIWRNGYLLESVQEDSCGRGAAPLGEGAGGLEDHIRGGGVKHGRETKHSKHPILGRAGGAY